MSDEERIPLDLDELERIQGELTHIAHCPEAGCKRCFVGPNGEEIHEDDIETPRRPAETFYEAILLDAAPELIRLARVGQGVEDGSWTRRI